MAQHQPQGSDAAENNVSVPIESTFFQPSQTKMLSSCNRKSTKIIPKSLPLRPDFSSTRGWPPNSKGSQCVDLLSSSCTKPMVKQCCGNRRLVAVDDEQGSNGYLLKLGCHVICLDRTLFNESFQVTHATPSTVCQKITCKSLQHSKKFRHYFFRLLQPRNECVPHQSPSGWRWSIPGRWYMVGDSVKLHVDMTHVAICENCETSESHSLVHSLRVLLVLDSAWL